VILAVLKLSRVPTEVRFHEVRHNRGMKNFKSVRVVAGN
jgi:hypothetical protein